MKSLVCCILSTHLLSLVVLCLLLGNTADCQLNCTAERNEPEFVLRDGHIVIPAFVPVHGTGATPLTCGDLIVDAALEVEALLFAIDLINIDENYLPGVQLGIAIFDSCSSSLNTNMLLSNILAGFQTISSSDQAVKAIIGPGLSDTVIDSTEIINSFHIAQISYSATSVELRNKTLFPYFLRTIPADDKLAEAMADLLTLQDWSYVTTLHSDTDYGRDGIGAFQEFAAKKGICIGGSFSVPQSASDQDYQAAVSDLLAVDGAAVVVLFLTREHTKQFLQVFQQESSVHLTFVAPETWDIYSDILDTVGDSLSGSFTIQQEQLSMPHLEAYLADLDPANDSQPWLAEYWESVFNCSLSSPPAGGATPCTGAENLAQLDSSVLQGHLTFAHYAVNAVFAMAEGLNQLLTDLCGGAGYSGVCAAYSANGGPTASQVYEAILGAQPPHGAGGVDFGFNNDGEGPARYAVYNYQHSEGNLIVGNWIDNQLTLNQSAVKLYDGQGQETSQLPSACQSVSCVEACQDSLSLPAPPGKPPLVFQAPDTLWGIIVLAVSGLGIFCCLALFMFFLANYQNVVIKEASSSLSYFLLLGLILLYVENLAFMFSPTITTCTLRRFGLSFFHTMIVAALFAKIVRIGRIARSSSPKVAFFRPWSQTAFYFLLLLPAVALLLPWLFFELPEVVSEIVEVDGGFEYIFVCGYSKKFFVIYQVYFYFLLFLTTINSIICLKYKDVEQESRFIFLSCLATIVAVLARILIYWYADPKFEIPAFCVSITANATIILAAIFVPKVVALDPNEKTVSNKEFDDQEEDIVKERNGDSNAGGHSNPAGPNMYTNMEDQLTSF